MEEKVVARKLRPKKSSAAVPPAVAGGPARACEGQQNAGGTKLMRNAPSLYLKMPPKNPPTRRKNP